MPLAETKVRTPAPERVWPACSGPFADRYPDSPIDFGTGFDCMDPLAHPDTADVPPAAHDSRERLAGLMQAHGFRPLAGEWWHFALTGEPFPETYFDFPVTAPADGRSVR